MRLRKIYRPELCVSRDTSRPALTSAYLSVERGGLIATDGVCMVILPCDIELTDKSGLIPCEALTAARKGLPRGQEYTSPIDCSTDTECVVYGKSGRLAISRNPDDASRYPDYMNVIPDPHERDAERDSRVFATFNAGLLARLAETMGADIVRMDLDSGDKFAPLMIRPQAAENRAFGVIMPCRSDAGVGDWRQLPVWFRPGNLRATKVA